MGATYHCHSQSSVRPCVSVLCPLLSLICDPYRPQAAAEKAYKKYWVEVEQFDLACNKKEAALANKKFADVLAALKAYREVAV